MSYISERIVKRKKYYYLEESFPFNGVLVKESVYFGSMYPSNDEIFLGYEVLKRTCIAREHTVLVPPLTEFVKNRTARIIQDLKSNYLADNSKSGREVCLDRKIINWLFDFSLKVNKKPILKNNISDALVYYQDCLKKKEPLNEAKVIKLHSLLLGNKECKNEDYSQQLLHLLLVWQREKDGLIYSAEFASKFFGKFCSMEPFKEYSPLLGFLMMNYILEENGFPFVLVSKKRMPAFQKALGAAKSENYRLVTEFIIFELKKNLK